MAGTLTITSTAFANNALIPPLHKNASICNEPNISPHIAWTVGGTLLTSMVESYIILVRDTTAGNFTHWYVTGIDPAQTFIGQGGTWVGSPTIAPTDYGSGDAPNGWNGPCAPSGTDNHYEIRVRAIIKDEFLIFLGLGKKTNWIDAETSYLFRDNISNVTPETPTGECGTISCPPGSELLDGKCQTITSVPIDIGITVYTAAAGDTNLDYGINGTRFYENADNYVFPLNGDDVTSALVDNDGAGVPLPFTVLNTDVPPWDHAGVSLLEGRLNIAGLWTTEPGTGNPIDEWIGFSRCITVPSTGKYSIGLGADNRMRFSINGILIAHFDTTIDKNHKWWHVIEVNLNEGVNIIEMEGYNSNLGSDAAFGAEIYNTDIATLKLLTTEAALEPYIEWSTRDRIGNDFNIGEFSGYTCPDGTAYDSCVGGQCSSIVFEDPTLLECCQVIENCSNPEETYLIKLYEGESTLIYEDYLYALSPFEGKCFKFLGLEFCTEPDYIDVTVTTSYPTDNCTICDPSLKMESCTTPGEFTYISLDGEVVLIAGNIYELDQLEGCQIYIGLDSETPPSKTEVIVVTDYETDDCLVCTPCYEFRNCDAGYGIYVRFAEGSPLPNEDDFFVYGLEGDPAIEDICWQFAGEGSCPGLATYEDVTIVKDYECANCETCIPYYKLTSCIDPTDIVYIQWSKVAAALTEGTAYVFDFTPNPNECYTAELDYSLCPDSELIDLPYWFKACVYGFMEALDWIVFAGQNPGNTFTYTIPSLIINGTEYITGPAQTYDLVYTANGIAGLDDVVANNDYGLTYRDQANGMNAIFVTLGIDHLIKAQTVINDEWAGTAEAGGEVQGGYYLVTRSDVTTFAIQLDDGSSYTNTLTESGNTNSGGSPDKPELGYDFFSCVNAAAIPATFVVDPITGVVTEEAF